MAGSSVFGERSPGPAPYSTPSSTARRLMMFDASGEAVATGRWPGASSVLICGAQPGKLRGQDPSHETYTTLAWFDQD